MVLKLQSLLKKLKIGSGYKKMKLNQRQEAVPRGFFPVYVVGGEERCCKKYIVPVEFLSSVRFQQFFDQYEEEIHAAMEAGITLPCSTQVFEAEFNIVKAEMKNSGRRSVMRCIN